MVKDAVVERARSLAPIRLPLIESHLAELTSRGNVPGAIIAPIGILRLVVSIKVAHATLVKSVSFSMLVSLLLARGDPGKINSSGPMDPGKINSTGPGIPDIPDTPGIQSPHPSVLQRRRKRANVFTLHKVQT